MNKSNGCFLTHKELHEKKENQKNHFAMLQVQSSIPNEWTKLLKQNILILTNISSLMFKVGIILILDVPPMLPQSYILVIYVNPDSRHI